MLEYSLQKTKLIFPNDIPFDLFNSKGQSLTHPVLHFHDCLELNYIISGSGINYIEDKKYIMKPGDLYLINNFEHHISAPDKSLVMKILVFDPKYIWQYDINNYEYLAPFYSKGKRFSNLINLKGDQLDKVRSIFDELEKEWIKQDKGYQLFIRSKLMELLAVIYRHLSTREQLENAYALQTSYERIRPSVEYINEHYNETLNLETLARLSCMSRTYFCSYFKNVMKTTLTEYIELIRINKACLLLRTTNNSILDICYSSGFNNISSFNTCFKKICCITPTQYRKQLKIDKIS